VSDPLGEALHLLRLTGTLYCRAEMTAPWGVEIPEMPGSMTFQVVTEGECVLEIGGDGPVPLRPGTMTLIPHGTAHRIRSHPGAATVPLWDLPTRQLTDRYESVDHGGGGALTRVMYGMVQFDNAAAARLVAHLPPVIRLDTWHDDGSWLHSTLRFITREAAELRPGGDVVITRLSDVLVVQAIRTWLESAPSTGHGWLAALRDAQLGRALAAIHREPARDWGVVSLAREAGLSRSAFSARFTGIVGEPVMAYLTGWRMHLAHLHLRDSTDPLPVVARRAGYHSEAAFGRAFKRTFGVSPGSVRNA